MRIAYAQRTGALLMSPVKIICQREQGRSSSNSFEALRAVLRQNNTADEYFPVRGIFFCLRALYGAYRGCLSVLI